MGLPSFEHQHERPRFWHNALPATLGTILACAVGTSANATAPQDLQVDRWADESGLFQATVTALARDTDGYLWAGTFGGLYRFSGSRFEETVADANLYSRMTRITALFSQGNDLWVGVESGGVWQVRDGKFFEVAQPEALSQATVWTFGDGATNDVLLIGTSAGVWQHDATNGWLRLTDEPALAFAIHGENTLVMGNDQSLMSVDLQNHTVTHLAYGSTYGFLEDPQGDLWVAQQDGLLLIDNQGAVHAAADWTATTPLGSRPMLDRSGDLWVPTMKGIQTLGHWTTAKQALLAGTPLTTQRLGLQDTPRSVLSDQEGTLWVGTLASGLVRLSERPFRQVPFPADVGGFSSGPLVAADDTIWLSVDCDHILAYRDGAWGDRIDVAAGPGPMTGSRCIHAMTARPDGAIVFGYPGFVWQVKDGTWTALADANNVLTPDEIPTLLHAVDTDLWLGTSQGRLLVSRAGGPFSLVPNPPSTARILALRVQGDDLILGTNSGLRIRRGGQWSAVGDKDTTPWGPVRDIHVGDDGTIWAATYGSGLGWVNAHGSGLLSPSEHGLPDGFLSSVTQTDDVMWLHGNRGLFQVESAALEAVRKGDIDRIPSHRIRVGEANGWARPSAWKTADGMLFLATVRGLVSFDTNAVLEREALGAVRIESFVAGDAELSGVDGRVTVPFEFGRDIEVTYSSPVLRPDQVARFQHRLLHAASTGTEPEFSVPTTRPFVRFSELSPGDYTFEVRAVGSNNEPGTSAALQFAIPALWHEQRAVQFGLTLSGSLVVVLLAWLRVRSAEQRNTRLREDLENRLKMEETLSEQQQYYRQMFDSAGNAFLLFDANARCIDSNREACRLFASEREGLLGQTPADLGLDAHSHSGGHVQCKRPDGSRFPARVVSATFTVGRRPNFLVSVIDLSELMREREQREHLRGQLQVARRVDAVGRLASGVAHDMNNVITAILGHAGLIDSVNDGQDPDIAESAAEILESARRGSRLVRRLLAFGRKKEDTPERCDVDIVVREMAGMMAQVLPADVELVLDLNDPGPVLLPQTEFEQILLNLVVNASDAMPKGGNILVRTLGHNRSVVLQVRDHGDGIPDAIRARLFEPFFTTKPAERGTGLGLATVKDIVESANGTISLLPAPDRGTVAEVVLPHADALDQTEPDTGALLESLKCGHGRTIVVVDDNNHVLSAMRLPLVRSGFEVQGFNQPSTAIDWIRSTAIPVSAVVTDVVMPGMSGREFVDSLRHTHPRIPVLFVSGYTSEAVLRRGVDESVENLLVKPFTGPELVVRVATLLDGESPLARHPNKAKPS